MAKARGTAGRKNAVSEGLGRLSGKDERWWKYMGRSRPRNGELFVYRGVSVEKGTLANVIKPGDWVTWDRKQAIELYGPTILEKRVKLNELIEANTNSNHSPEFWYSP